MNKLNLSKELSSLMSTLSEGAHPYIVGGFVRDALLGKTSKDIDIEIFGVMAKDVDKKLSTLKYPFERRSEVFPVWVIEHPTLGDIEIALPRTERKIGTGYGGFETTVDPFMSLYDAAKRRDFTVNAIYCDKDGIIFDPLNGAYDLDMGIIRPCSPETFCDDPTRLLRVGYFVNKLGFEVAPEIYNMVNNEILEELGKTDQKSLGTFWDKFFGNTTSEWYLEMAFSFFEEIGLTQKFFPSILGLNKIQQNPKFHPEGNVWNHTLICVTKACESGGIMPYVALFHDVGKKVTTNSDLKAPGHAKESERMAEQDLAFFGFSEKTMKKSFFEILELIKYHMVFLDLHPKRLIMLADEFKHVTFRKLLWFHEIDLLGRLKKQGDVWQEISTLQDVLVKYMVLDGPYPKVISGTDIMDTFNIKPAKGSNIIGVLLNKVRKEQYKNPYLTTADALCFLRTCHEVRQINGSDIIQHFGVEGKEVGKLVDRALDYQIMGYSKENTLKLIKRDMENGYVF